MKKRAAVYTTTAREAYAIELRRMQERVNNLREMMLEAIGDGMLPDSIEWADVGSVKKVNQILGEALQIGM
jgi:hypothetical protein